MPDAEFNLLVACCRSAFTEAAQPGVSEGIDWSRFLRLAERHRVEGFAWEALRERELAPISVAGALEEDSTRTVKANLHAAAECRRLHQMFQRKGVPLLFVKGLTLGTLTYRDPLLKKSCDIDLLVPAGRIHEAGALLRQAGYRQVIPASASLRRWHERRKESVWRHEISHQQLDLHTRLADNSRLVPGIGMESPRQVVEVAQSIELPTLARDELFAYLCVHGASSAWFRLKWLTDLAALIAPNSPADTERLYTRSQDLGAGRSAGQALLLAHWLFETPLSPRLHHRLGTDRAINWLARVALGQINSEVEPTTRLFGTAMIHASQLLILPGLKFKLSELGRQVADLVT